VCDEYCTAHDRPCEGNPDHDGDHQCIGCPDGRKLQRARMIADRVAAHHIYTDTIETTPDVD
jgi:hypothetical protein